MQSCENADAEVFILGAGTSGISAAKALYDNGVTDFIILEQILNDDGRTTSKREKILTISVKRGWKEGTKITFQKEGDQGPNRIPADIVFTVKDKPHERFTREGSDLIYKPIIPLVTALTGGSTEVSTLDGRIIRVPITEIVSPDYRKRVVGEGMPLVQDPSQRGDLVVEFGIEFPQTLNRPEQKVLIKQALL